MFASYVANICKLLRYYKSNDYALSKIAYGQLEFTNISIPRLCTTLLSKEFLIQTAAR